MSTMRIEDRVNELETKYSELIDQVAKLSNRSDGPAEDAQTPWWKRIMGIYENNPAFDEAERLRLEYRASLDRDPEALF